MHTTVIEWFVLCQSKVTSRECARLVNVELLKLLEERRYLLLADLA